MANISFFYPQRLQGTALGLNAGVGNLGVGLAQLITPIAIYGGALLILGGDAQILSGEVAATTQMWLQNAGFIWVPFILVAAIAAYLGMANIATVPDLLCKARPFHYGYSSYWRLYPALAVVTSLPACPISASSSPNGCRD